jgi:hypothetical protein
MVAQALRVPRIAGRRPFGVVGRERFAQTASNKGPFPASTPPPSLRRLERRSKGQVASASVSFQVVVLIPHLLAWFQSLLLG